MKEFLVNKESDMLNLLERLVNIDSGSSDKEGINKVGTVLTSEFEKLGFKVVVLQEKDRGNHLLMQQEQATNPKIILLAHMDTVYPKGTAAERPFMIRDGRAYGPGVIDMKASHITLLFALQALFNENPQLLTNLTILFTSDKEMGSPSSESLIKKYAQGKEYALVMEPARPDGSLITARSGVGRFVMTVMGKAAHAGENLEDGCDAIEELARKVVKLHALTERKKGVSVNVGLIKGGTSVNTVASYAEAELDLRISKNEQQIWLEKKVHAICSEPDITGTSIELVGGFERLPMVKSERTVALLDKIQEIGEQLGIEITDVAAGGGSDASFTSAMGIATIDGMGPIGGYEDIEGEYVEIQSLSERSVLLAYTIERLSKKD